MLYIDDKLEVEALVLLGLQQDIIGVYTVLQVLGVIFNGVDIFQPGTILSEKLNHKNIVESTD